MLFKRVWAGFHGAQSVFWSTCLNLTLVTIQTQARSLQIFICLLIVGPLILSLINFYSHPQMALFFILLWTQHLWCQTDTVLSLISNYKHHNHHGVGGLVAGNLSHLTLKSHQCGQTWWRCRAVTVQSCASPLNLLKHGLAVTNCILIILSY